MGELSSSSNPAKGPSKANGFSSGFGSIKTKPERFSKEETSFCNLRIVNVW